MDEEQSRLRRKYKNEIVRKMRASGTYRQEHQFVISMLADMFADYDAMVAAFEREDGHLVTGAFTSDSDREDAADVFLATLEDMKWPKG